MKKTRFLLLGLIISIFSLVIQPIIFQNVSVYASEKQKQSSSNLKIEIVKVKDSGTSPFWSPDGKEIVYIDKGGLFVISSAGSGNERRIVNGGVRFPRWSPDGKYIAYVDRFGLRIISPHKPLQPKLLYPDNKVQMPEWSNDSQWITFYLSDLQGRPGNGVFAVNINTLKSKQFSHTGINPCWNGDGSSVFYFSDDDKNEGFGQLYLAGLNSSDVKKVAPVGGVCMNFNLEGDLLAFAPKRKDGTSRGIYVSSPFNNDEMIKLSDDGYFPSFSFDNKWISFFRHNIQRHRTDVYITPPTGGVPPLL